MYDDPAEDMTPTDPFAPLVGRMQVVDHPLGCGRLVLCMFSGCPFARQVAETRERAELPALMEHAAAHEWGPAKRARRSTP